MLILVTSASGINGNGYGALLAFKRDGTLIGPSTMTAGLLIRADLSWIKRRPTPRAGLSARVGAPPLARALTDKAMAL